MRMLWALSVALLVADVVDATVQCRDMDGNGVDWFIFYKIPKNMNPTPPNAYITQGSGFLYLDSNNKQWTVSSVGMDSPKQAIYHTLQYYYTADLSQTFSIMYNDEFPNSTVWSNDSGHTKGVSVFDVQTGFWLIHSIPKFPSNQSYEFPSNAYYYGQMGICISFRYEQLGNVAQQLFYNQPFIYQMSLPPKFVSDFPILAYVQRGQTQNVPPYTNVLTMTSAAGQIFTSFAKTGIWGRDLYYDLVSPTLMTSLDVESWNHQTDSSKNLNSWCSKNNLTQVLDVKSVSLVDKIAFTTYEDHSKYAVAFNPKVGGSVTPWVCVGDINRQTHQMQRGGGTMCINDGQLYSVFASMIDQVYSCEVIQ